MKKLLLTGLALLVLVGCSSKEASKTIKVGLVGQDQATSWKYVVEEAKKEDINLELIFFNDYPQPNRALNSGEIDINAFQHYKYLNNEIKENNYELASIGDTFYSPLGLYSKLINNIDQLKENDTIAIPNDPTNGGRALQLLEFNGLITLDESDLPDIKSIKQNPKNFKILELDAANIPSILNEVALAAINSGIAVDNDLSPKNDALVLEQLTAGNHDYINIIAVRKAEKDNPTYKRIVELYQTERVKEIMNEETGGASIPVF